MAQVHELADFVARARGADLSAAARDQLKLRVLDALGCALGALAGEPIPLLRAYLDEAGAPGRCSLIGGGTAGPEHAAFLNGALVRY
ncbi:MAG TPA: MmgE/PrpD family protein, partial [Polyangia bacterium]